MVTNNQEGKRREGKFKGITKTKYSYSWYAREDKTTHLIMRVYGSDTLINIRLKEHMDILTNFLGLMICRPL